jgi:hypothetical protein
MSVVFVGNLPEPLEVGHVIVVAGRLRHNAQRFDLNLASGRTINEHLPLHLSWRQGENMIVRNTKDQRGWGTEDRHQHRNHASQDLGVQRGQDFEITFTVQHSWFDVAINGLPYCQYHHRMPMQNVRTIIVERDVELIRAVSQRRVTPYMYPSRTFPIDHRLAFTQEIPNPPKPGTVIVVTATPTGNSRGRFVIVLRQGIAKQQALHISTRFADGSVVRNTRDPNGNWGHEERHGHFPFALNRPFRLAIGFGNNTFHIAIDGNRYTDFGFRTPDVYGTVSALTVSGDDGLIMNITGVDHVRDNSPNMFSLNQLSSLANPLTRNF